MTLTNAIHHVQGEFALKLEGGAIIVYPGAYRLTPAEWASAVAFTSARGETGETYQEALEFLTHE